MGLLRVVSNESIYRQTSLSNAPKLITVIGVNQIRLRATPNSQARRRAVVLWIFLVPAHSCKRFAATLRGNARILLSQVAKMRRICFFL